MDKKISFEEAKRLSILRWQAIVDHNPVPEECKNITCFCGFCERHDFQLYNEINLECNDCEFGKAAGKCTNDDSLYGLWTLLDEEDDEYKTQSLKILDVIKSLEENS